MTDISITAANVLAGANSVQEQGTAGATITAGQGLYKDTADNKWKLADSNSGTAAVRQASALSLHGASDGQPLRVHKLGDITIGGTMTAGVAYYLSDTPGGICPVADIGSGEYAGFLGMAKSATVLAFAPNYSGVAL